MFLYSVCLYIIVIFLYNKQSLFHFPFVLISDQPGSTMNVGQASDVPLKIDEPNLNVLRASIKSPSGKEEPCTLKRLPNGNIGKPETVTFH